MLQKPLEKAASGESEFLPRSPDKSRVRNLEVQPESSCTTESLPEICGDGRKPQLIGEEFAELKKQLRERKNFLKVL